MGSTSNVLVGFVVLVGATRAQARDYASGTLSGVAGYDTRIYTNVPFGAGDSWVALQGGPSSTMKLEVWDQDCGYEIGESTDQSGTARVTFNLSTDHNIIIKVYNTGTVANDYVVVVSN